ncbi:unnamed protein product, partial [Prorocentrum cordatum]
MQAGGAVFSDGQVVQAKWQDRHWFPGRIAKANGNGTFAIRYDDGGFEAVVPAHLIRPVAGAAGGAQPVQAVLAPPGACPQPAAAVASRGPLPVGGVSLSPLAAGSVSMSPGAGLQLRGGHAAAALGRGATPASNPAGSPAASGQTPQIQAPGAAAPAVPPRILRPADAGATRQMMQLSSGAQEGAEFAVTRAPSFAQGAAESVGSAGSVAVAAQVPPPPARSTSAASAGVGSGVLGPPVTVVAQAQVAQQAEPVGAPVVTRQLPATAAASRPAPAQRAAAAPAAPQPVLGPPVTATVAPVAAATSPRARRGSAPSPAARGGSAGSPADSDSSSCSSSGEDDDEADDKETDGKASATPSRHAPVRRGPSFWEQARDGLDRFKEFLENVPVSAAAEPIAKDRATDDQHLNSVSIEYSDGDVSAATKGFSGDALLGSGAFGSVYRGTMKDGTEVAIKLLKVPDEAGFEDEVKVLSRFRHPNLVILLGFARHHKSGYRSLIYEFLAGGDAARRISQSKQGKQPFQARMRLSVALDAASGLSHLHNAKPRAFHRD